MTDKFEVWLSLVERCVRDAEAASSNLVASIILSKTVKRGLAHIDLIRPRGQAVKTTPSHGVIPGSIPGEVILRTPEFFSGVFL